MGMQTESLDIIARPGNATGVGSIVFQANETGITVNAPTKFKDGTAVMHQYEVVTVQVLAATVDQGIFSPMEGIWTLAGVMHTNRVAGSDGGAVTADIMACDSGEAPASGVTQLLTADSINLKATADIPVQKALAAVLEEVGPSKYFALNVTGTLTAVVSSITCQFKRVR